MKSIRGFFFNYFFFTIVVVFGVLTAFLYRSSTHYLEASMIHDNSNILDNISKNISSHYRGRLMSLEYLARDISQLGAKNNADKIKSYLKYETLIGSVHLYDRKGQLLLAEKKTELPTYNIGKSIFENDKSFAPYAMKAMDENHSVLTPIFLSQKTKYYQTYMVPIRDKKNEVQGLLSGAVFPFLTDLKYTIEGLSLGEDNIFVIAADGGYILAQTADLSENIKTFIKNYLPPGVHSPNDTQVTKIPAGKSFPFYVLNKSNPDTESHFLFFVSKKGLTQKKDEMFNSAVIAYLLSLITGLIAATLISHLLSRPLNKLYKVLTRINQGDFTARTSIKGPDVLSKICEECDLLSKNIEKDRYIATLWSGKLEEHDNPVE